MSTMHRYGLALALLLGATCAACGGEDTRFVVRNASDFRVGPQKISVFGVFRDGQMSPSAWTELAPSLSTVLGNNTCDVGFGDKLQDAKPELFTSADDSAKADGITEDLLAQFAPMATGDVIMVVYVHGKIRGPVTPSQEPSGNAMSNSMGRGGGGRGRGGGRMGPSPPPRPLTDDLEIAAALFSVKDHHAIARTTMTYVGPSFDNAVKLFVAKLQTEIPGSTCSGWDWKGPH